MFFVIQKNEDGEIVLHTYENKTGMEYGINHGFFGEDIGFRKLDGNDFGVEDIASKFECGDCLVIEGTVRVPTQETIWKL